MPLCSGMHRGEEPLEGLHVNLKPDRCQASTERKYALGPAIEAGPFLFRRGACLNKVHQKKEFSRTIAQPSGSVQWRLAVQAKTPTECIKLVE